MTMETCVKCGEKVEKEEGYEINDKFYCEDCAMAVKAAGNPGKRCGQ